MILIGCQYLVAKLTMKIILYDHGTKRCVHKDRIANLNNILYEIFIRASFELQTK